VKLVVELLVVLVGGVELVLFEPPVWLVVQLDVELSGGGGGTPPDPLELVLLFVPLLGGGITYDS